MRGFRDLWDLRGLRDRVLMGLRGCYIYIVRWLGHHGNRQHGFMGLRSKKSDWVTRQLDTP